MSDSSVIPYPTKWSSITAPETRFSAFLYLYEIVNWSKDIRFSPHGSQFSDFCFFFFDDFEFSENPESMVGEALFEDEILYIRRFIDAFEPFVDSVPDELSFGVIDKSKITPPPIVIERAKELYEKLLEKGDPEVERYLK